MHAVVNRVDDLTAVTAMQLWVSVMAVARRAEREPAGPNCGQARQGGLPSTPWRPPCVLR